MKLPLDLALFLRRENRPPLEYERLPLVAPPTQNSTVAINNAAMAPHMKPNAYRPRVAFWLLAWKALRPATYVALHMVLDRSEGRRVWIL